MSRHAPALVKLSFVLIIVFAIIGYIIFNTRIFIRGPQLIVESLVSGQTSDEKLVEVSGQVINTSSVSINDRAISIDENGNFTEPVLLYEGYNIIIMKAKDKFDRQVTKQLDIVYNTDKTLSKESDLETS